MEGGAEKHRSKIDPYGFERAEDFDYSSYEEFMASYLRVLARRASRWSSVVGSNGAVPKTRKLKRYVRKGIPAEHRTAIWMYSSGAEAKLKANPGMYENLLSQQHDPKLVETIQLDIPRTFPENIYFQDTPTDPNAKRRPLYNILVALGHKNPQIGYCQGLNFIAGILLLVVKNDEKVFWLMDTLVNDILPGYHTPDMASAKVDYEVLGQLVKSKMPRVHQHFSNGGVMWSIICAKWFICVYADVLPIETTLRVWDCLFYEGAKIVFRVGLALIKLNEAEFLACRSFTEIMELFKQIPRSKQTMHCHQFMQSIFKEPGSLSWATIEKLRIQCKDMEPT